MTVALNLRAQAELLRRKRAKRKGPYQKFQEKYKDDPGGFVQDCFTWKEGEGPTFYQKDVLRELIEYKRIAIRGPHGLGKTALASWIVLWFCLTRDGDEDRDFKVPMTASNWRQLSKYLFPEVHKWIRRLNWKMIGRPPFKKKVELMELSLKLSTGEAFCLASKQPAALEGVHANSVLYVLDESKAIQDGIWDSVEGALSTGNKDGDEVYVLAISTPGPQMGRFYEIHSKKEGLEDWHTKHITMADSILAGRMDPAWAEQRKAQWGEKSSTYQNKILGEFAADDSMGVIPFSWVALANQRWELLRDEVEDFGEVETLGVDVAGATEGSDSSVLAPMHKNYVIGHIQVYPEGNIDTATMEVAGYVKGFVDINTKAIPIIDVIGIGTGVADRLSEMEYGIRRFIASEKTDAMDESGKFGFFNKRAATWWRMREMLNPESGVDVALPPEADLIRELTVPQWTMQSGARYKIEGKKDIRKRLGRSTDMADAVILALTGLEFTDPERWDVEATSLEELIKKARENAAPRA
jgi:hypothetical protein